MTPIETVQQIYADFGRGDVPAILAALADDVEWDVDVFPNDIPWLQPRRGRAEVQRFFESLAGLEFTQFEPRHVLADGALVVALCNVSCTVKATGKRIVQPDEVHVWRFDAQGRVAQFRHRVDTLMHAMAIRGD